MSSEQVRREQQPTDRYATPREKDEGAAREQGRTDKDAPGSVVRRTLGSLPEEAPGSVAGERRVGDGGEPPADPRSLPPEEQTARVGPPARIPGERAGPVEAAAARLAGTYQAIKAAEQLNEVSDALDPALPDSSALHEILDLAAGPAGPLQSARQEVLQALEREQRDRAAADALGQLLPAAQQLLDGFDRFLADGKLWATTEER